MRSSSSTRATSPIAWSRCCGGPAPISSDLTAVPGEVPNASRAEGAVLDLKRAGKRVKALFATHVDTSDRRALRPEAAGGSWRALTTSLSVFDGVCATAGERFEMDAWGADVYLTASQKAIGLPPGLALLVASERALAARDARKAPPPLAVGLALVDPDHAGLRGAGSPRTSRRRRRASSWP